MYNPEEIQTHQDELRQAVLHARPFKPLYVKMKVFYGCNLKCETRSLSFPRATPQ